MLDTKETLERALENAKKYVSNLLLQKELDWKEIDKSIEKLKKYDKKIKDLIQFYYIYTLLCLTKCSCEERTIKHNG